MTRYSFFLIAALGAALLADGCSNPSAADDVLTINKTWVPGSALPGSSPTYGDLYLTAQRAQGNGNVTIQSGGEVFRDILHSKGVDGGAMLISNYSITRQVNGSYSSYSSSPKFGAVTTWGLTGNSGNGIAGFTGSMYVPAIISLSTPVGQKGVSKRADLPLEWNADPRNESVAIDLDYEADISQVRDSTLPGEEYHWRKWAPDNGSYTIPASVLATLPVRGFIRIKISRGNATMIGSAMQKYHVYAYTYADKIMEVIP